ncbi:Enolase-phosphatase E1 [Wickerhamomyces ciferrii]|uniref:Enolase-phosphatase E1 n=1 Tax=Wickerhamomyces ciferrii (strain ATCC 14091 / BCRC 22168 / CBS 111 / JCM 3599 / NBRC 0793 / NRRL Y-1031 F-60-10) TaxID=1206466 RepID=K0KYL1_WICCF|nr:Enolase-phosphatase E1 [Wickerhamomyces ciferrii]CCH46168.1 Enolase-phosphatase E1 [Wickerhamomyces ciferrii]
MTQFNSINAIILDIEGTVAPISFVKETLFPYFLKEIPSILSKLQYPISSETSNVIEQIVSNFPKDITNSNESLLNHIKSLVNKDIKDSTLKSLQGFIWEKGYENGDIKAPVYDDAIKSIKNWSESKKVYIYSSGSVKAQKLLFKYVEFQNGVIDLNEYLSDYFDITTSGYKFEKSSYENIIQDIKQSSGNVLFLSDNVSEVSAAKEAGLKSLIVFRNGNGEVSKEDQDKYGLIKSFDELSV